MPTALSPRAYGYGPNTIGADQHLHIGLRTALVLVLGVWGVVTIYLGSSHSFYLQQHPAHEQDQGWAAGWLRSSSVHIEHVTDFPGNAAQGVEAALFADRGYALLLTSNYYGKSQLLLWREAEPDKVQTVAACQTACAHSWSAWKVNCGDAARGEA